MSSSGGAGAVVRQGHLRKLKTMKKKFFVLRADTPQCGARLEYYESEKKFRSGASPRRVLPLKSCYNVTRRLDLKQKHVIALFTKEEQFCVVAENETDLHAWLTVILRYHTSGSDEASQELLHPTQHVWQVNVQRKGLGASKNIIGLYNLCLTDKTLTLVKIKSHNNIISDLGIPERIEYSLKNIRRCGDSECFFYMEVGRQTTTGAGELWMHSDDSNIAQSMHSTIYHAMRNCAKETENERSHISMPQGSSLDLSNPMPARRQTYSGTRRVLLSNENKGLCVGSCIKQCVCTSSVTYSIDDSAAIAPLNNENQPPNLVTEKTEKAENRLVTHHRTVSLPTGYPTFQEPLKIVHERTRSAPLTGDEVDRAILEKAVRHSSCKAVNGTDSFFNKKNQWTRRASTGTRCKLSPAHSKNSATLRNRCDSMPSRVSAVMEAERHPPRHTDLIEGVDLSRDEIDGGEWLRTPRIPEEPDYCEMSPRDPFSALGGSCGASRTSSQCTPEGGGYLHMADLSPSAASLASGEHHRFAEFQLEPATSHIIDMEARPPRAYSVGSRPGRPAAAADTRLRAYSVGARSRPAPSAAPRASADDLMELDFSTRRDEYVEMKPEPPAAPPDGYVEMSYKRRPDGSRPIPIATPAPRPPPAPASPPRSPVERKRLGSQTIFPLSLDSPADEPEQEEPATHHPLSTVREISEEGARRSPDAVSVSPQYVQLAGLHYAALDLEPRAPDGASGPACARTYTQIDFARCEKLHVADGN